MTVGLGLLRVRCAALACMGYRGLAWCGDGLKSLCRVGWQVAVGLVTVLLVSLRVQGGLRGRIVGDALGRGLWRTHDKCGILAAASLLLEYCGEKGVGYIFLHPCPRSPPLPHADTAEIQTHVKDTMQCATDNMKEPACNQQAPNRSNLSGKANLTHITD